MSIIDSEEGSLWPIFHFGLIRWFHDIEDNGNSIFIVIPHYALVCVGSVRFDHSITFDTAFSRLMVWQDDFSRVRKLLSQKIH